MTYDYQEDPIMYSVIFMFIGAVITIIALIVMIVLIAVRLSRVKKAKKENT